jgi:tetratricopeptide (TPR) repeat protein
MLLRLPDIIASGKKPDTTAQRRRPTRHLKLFIAAIILLPLLFCGCSHFNDQPRPTFLEANDLFSRGEYTASLEKYRQIIEKNPAEGDRVLFEMGIIHAYPGNEQKDYQRALECFSRLIKEYPGSGYRKDSELMVFNIGNVIAKDRTIAAQQAQIEALRQDLQVRGNQSSALQQKVETLEQELKGKEAEITTLKKEVIIIPKGPADRILIEKKERRLTLFSKGRALKTYQIALGGNPNGPKERQGDNKTPEGIYRIDARNRNSQFHLSLHISYPNEKDKKRARELGVSPGGDIMIHGIKNGFSWVGEQHVELDWTKGCIAVTDEEIEEIEKVVPNGTVVEIRP